MPRVTAGDIELNVVRLGSGPPTVVFLHGLVVDNLTSFCFTIADGVAQHAESICYDQRGHGRSDRPATGYSPADGAADLAALLDSLGIEGPVYLCGNSYACVVQLEFALRYPERVAGLIIMEGHIVRAGWGETMLETMDMGFWMVKEPDSQEWLARYQTRKIRQQLAATTALVCETSLMADLRYAPVTDFDALARIDFPVLLLYGEFSDILDVGHLLHETIPGSELVVIPDVGHSVLQQKTDEAQAHMIRWLLERPEHPARPAPPAVAQEVVPSPVS